MNERHAIQSVQVPSEASVAQELYGQWAGEAGHLASDEKLRQIAKRALEAGHIFFQAVSARIGEIGRDPLLRQTALSFGTKPFTPLDLARRFVEQAPSPQENVAVRCGTVLAQMRIEGVVKVVTSQAGEPVFQVCAPGDAPS